MADEIDRLIDRMIDKRASLDALADMYPSDHVDILRVRAEIAVLKLEIVTASIRVERQRCHDIVMAARMHEIETDLRSVLAFIERGEFVEDLKR